MKYVSANIFTSEKKNKGGIMIQVLAGFTVLMVIILLFTSGYTVVKKTMTEEQGFHPYEFAVFTAQLEIEVKQADSISVSSTGDRLVLISAGSVISYEPYGTGIRRRVNYSGHQMMLQQASHVTFSSGEQAVAVEAEGAGRTFRAAMLFPSGLLRGYHQSEQTPELKERITSEYCQPGRNDTESHNCQVAEAAYERE